MAHDLLYRIGLERSQESHVTRLVALMRNILLDWYYWPRARSKFIEGMQHTHSYDEVWKFLVNYDPGGFYHWLRPIQRDDEIKALALRVYDLKPRNIIEIGTCGGGTLLIWSQSSPVLNQLISIDLPGGLFGGGYPPQKAKLYRLFTHNHPQTRLELIRGNSHEEEMRNRTNKLLQGELIDFLFIDGDHRYEGVKKDYELYSPLVRSGGLIAFHDILPRNSNPEMEVHKFWNELKAKGGTTEEFVQGSRDSGYGIGLLTQP